MDDCSFSLCHWIYFVRSIKETSTLHIAFLYFHEVFIVLNKIFSKGKRSLFTVKVFLRE
jgi:hypothetical protein